MSLISDFGSEHLSIARFAAFSIWQDPETKTILKAITSEENFLLFAEKLIDSESNKGNSFTKRDLFLITDYFDIVNACVESKTCDKEILLRNLGPYAEDFFKLYEKPYIEKVRNTPGLQSNSFGVGLESFVEEYTKSQQTKVK